MKTFRITFNIGITAVVFLSLSLNAFAQGPPWQPNGQNIVHTGRDVGINTNTPAYDLDVDGIIRSSVLSGGNGIVSYNNDGVLQQLPFTQSVQDVLRGDGTWLQIPFTSHWTLSGNDLSYTLGAVSIGTNVPQGIFTVTGASFFNGDVAVNGVLSVIRIVNADTIGVGPGTPTTTFDVFGNARITGNLETGNFNTQEITASDRITTPRITSPDSVLSIGNNTIQIIHTQNRIQPGIGQFGDPAGLGFGKNTFGLGARSIAIGLNVETSIPDAIVIGTGISVTNRLVNNLRNTLMVGFNSDKSTLFVSGGNGTSGSFGRVGIGTTSPNSKLAVIGSVYIEGGDVTESWTQSHWNVVLKTPLASAAWRSTVPATVNNKYLGYGMTNTGWYWIMSPSIDDNQPPEYPMVLELTGSTGGRLKINQSSNTAWAAEFTNLGGDGKVLRLQGANGNGTHVFQVDDNYGNTNFVVTSSGNVFAREFKVTLSAFDDYVFDEDYTLKPLRKVKQQVLTDHHLDGIPSEPDVLKNGLSLGKFGSGLLKHVEENKLYLIGHDERLTALEDKNNRLEKIIEKQQREIEELKKRFAYNRPEQQGQRTN